MREPEIRALQLWEYVDFIDCIYEQSRDPDNLDEEAETAYQQRKWRKVKASRD